MGRREATVRIREAGKDEGHCPEAQVNIAMREVIFGPACSGKGEAHERLKGTEMTPMCKDTLVPTTGQGEPSRLYPSVEGTPPPVTVRTSDAGDKRLQPL